MPSILAKLSPLENLQLIPASPVPERAVIVPVPVPKAQRRLIAIRAPHRVAKLSPLDASLSEEANAKRRNPPRIPKPEPLLTSLSAVTLRVEQPFPSQSAVTHSPKPSFPSNAAASSNDAVSSLLAALRPAKEVRSVHSTGFDRLHEAIRACTRRIEGDSLDAKFRAVADHIAGYHYESDSVKSADLCLEFYSKRMKNTMQLSGGSISDPLIAAGCCVLDVMCDWLCRFQPRFEEVCDLVKDHLIGAIFFDPETESFRKIDGLQCSPLLLETGAELFNQQTFISQVREYQSQLKEAQGEQTHSEELLSDLKKELQYWKQQSTERAFMAWRMMSMNQKRIRQECEAINAQLGEKDQHIASLEEENATLKAQVEHLQLGHKKYAKRISELEIAALESAENMRDLRDQLTVAEEKMNILLHKEAKHINKEAQLVEARNQLEVYRSLLNSVVDTFRLPAWRNATEMEILSEGEFQSGSDRFFKWFQHVISLHPAAHFLKPVQHFQGGSDILDHLIIFIAELLKDQLPPNFSKQALGLAEPEKVKKIVKALDSLVTKGILLYNPLKAEDLPTPTGGLSILCFVSMLYQQFADPSVEFKDHHESIQGPTEESKQRRKECVTWTVSQWKSYIDQLQSQCQKWKVHAYRAVYISQKACLDALRVANI